MASISLPVQDHLWKRFLDLARARRRKPETLAAEVLAEGLQRLIAEKLYEDTCKEAGRAQFREEDTEEVIRQWRRKKAEQVKHGRPKVASARSA